MTPEEQPSRADGGPRTFWVGVRMFQYSQGKATVEGWATKQGAPAKWYGRKSWKRRYMVLSPDPPTLAYHVSPGGKQKGLLSLVGAVVEADTDPDRPNILCLSVPASATKPARDLRCFTDTRVERTAFIAALQAAIAGPDAASILAAWSAASTALGASSTHSTPIPASPTASTYETTALLEALRATGFAAFVKPVAEACVDAFEDADELTLREVSLVLGKAEVSAEGQIMVRGWLKKHSGENALVSSPVGEMPPQPEPTHAGATPTATLPHTAATETPVAASPPPPSPPTPAPAPVTASPAPPSGVVGRVGAATETLLSGVSGASDTYTAAVEDGKAALSTVGAFALPLISIIPGGDAALKEAESAVEFAADVALRFVGAVEQLTGTIPFVGAFATALKGVLAVYQVYKAHEKSIRRFQCRVQQLSAMVARFVVLKAEKAGAGMTEPEQLNEFTNLLTKGKAIIESYATRGTLSKIFLGHRDTDELGGLEKRLTQCMTDMQTALAVTGLEGQVEMLSSQQTMYTEMVEANNRILAKLEELGGVTAVRCDPAKLSEVLSLLTDNAEEVKALMTRNFEELSAQIAAGFNNGIFRNIRKPCFRLLWAEFIGSLEMVKLDSFFLSVGTFMEDKLKMQEEDVGSILTEANVAAVTALLDQDKDNMISVVELNAVSRKEEGEFVEVILRWIEKSRLPPFKSSPPPSPFIGYTAQLDDAVSAVAGTGGRVMCVGGPQGCGLTSFLRRACEVARERAAFPGGVYMLDAQAVLAEDALLANLCVVIGLSVSGAAKDAVAAWTRRLSQPTLVVVDGGRAPLAKWLSLFESVASQSAKLHVILGCSSSAAEVAEFRVRLSGWSEDETTAFVRSRPVGASLPAETVAGVHRKCSGLPRAVHQLLLNDREDVLTLVAGVPALTVAARMTSVSAESRALLKKLSVFPASFSIGAVVAVGGLAVEDAASALLAEVARWGLVQCTGQERWFVDASVEKEEVTGETLAAFVEYFVGIVNSAATSFASSALMTGLALFDEERDNLNVVFELCKAGVAQSGEVQSALVKLQSNLNILGARLSVGDQLLVAEGLLAVRQAALGPQHPDVAASLHCVAVVFWKQRKLEEALALHREALELRKATLGSQHPDVAQSLNNIANVLSEQGKLDEALALYHEALEIRKVALGPQDRNVADTLNNIAIVLKDQGKLEEALVMYHEALEIRKAVLGPQHPDVAISLNNIAIVLSKQWNMDEALAMHREALEIKKAALGPHHPDVGTSLNNMAVVLSKQGKLDEAVAMYREALEVFIAALGPQHPDVAVSLNNIARELSDQGKLDEAVALFREALEIRKAALGPQHPLVAASLSNIASIEKMLAEPGEEANTKKGRCTHQ